MSTPADLPRRVVVVGGGVGGVSTCAALRAGGYDGSLVLLDAGEFPHDRPPLSKELLAGHRTREEVALEPASWYADHDVELRTATRVTRLLPHEASVETRQGELLTADRVVLATGGGALRPAAAGPADSAGRDRVHVLRSLPDADRLAAALTRSAHLLVVGAGFLGAEVAATARGLGCQVTLVDPVEVPLVGAVGPAMATWLHDQHTLHGVTVRHASVRSLAAGPTGVAAVLSGDDRPSRFDAVLFAVGMAPVVDLAAAAGLEVDPATGAARSGGIVVGPDQTTSVPAVLAVGDATRRRRPDGVLAARAEHWEAAQRDGQRAAATVLGAARPPESAPWFWSDRYDRHLEVVGDLSSGTRVLRGSFDDPSFAVFAVADGQVVGAASVDEPKAVRAARRMIDRRVPIGAAGLEALADPAVPLRSLL